MKTQDVGNNNYFSSKKIISSSILGGLAAASVERAFLPNEVKAAIKNTRFGEDAFLKKTAECAEKTIKNLGTSKINPQQVIENAKNIYMCLVMCKTMCYTAVLLRKEHSNNGGEEE